MLVAYDVGNDRRRGRVAAALGQWGRRIQYSVFLLVRGGAEEVTQALSPLVEGDQDRVRIQPLCATCEAKAIELGAGAAGSPSGDYRLY